jgi:hypothetical protein
MNSYLTLFPGSIPSCRVLNYSFRVVCWRSASLILLDTGWNFKQKENVFLRGRTEEPKLLCLSGYRQISYWWDCKACLIVVLVEGYPTSARADSVLRNRSTGNWKSKRMLMDQRATGRLVGAWVHSLYHTRIISGLRLKNQISLPPVLR